MYRFLVLFVAMASTLLAFNREQVVQDILSQGSVMQYAQDLPIDSPVVEDAYQYFVQEICSSYPTRRRYAQAISKAAQYLSEHLQTQIEKISTQTHFPSLLIGINYRGSQYELSGCINDIEHISETFLQRYLNVNPKDITVMSDDMIGTDLYPTRENMLEQLKQFCARVNEAGQGFLHYSGHGSWVADRSHDESDHRDETLVPVDFAQAGQLTDDVLFDVLRGHLKPGVKLTALLDCCHSGSAFDLPYRWSLNGEAIIENVFWKVEAELPDIVLLSASHDTQTAAEYQTDQGISGGAMTAAFLQAIKNQSSVMSYTELLNALHAYMRQSQFEQIPQITSTRRIDLGSQFLEKKILLRP